MREALISAGAGAVLGLLTILGLTGAIGDNGQEVANPNAVQYADE